jgi:hypothetical protein
VIQRLVQQRENVKVLHAVKDPLMRAAIRINVQNEFESGCEATPAISFISLWLRVATFRMLML